MKVFPNCYTCICLFSTLFKFYLNHFQHSTSLIWSLKFIPKQQMNQFWKSGLIHYTSKELLYSGKSCTCTFPNKVVLVCSEEDYHQAAGAEKTFLSANLNHSSCKPSRVLILRKFHPHQLMPFTWAGGFSSHFSLFINRETVRVQQSISHLVGKKIIMRNLRLVHYFESAQLIIWYILKKEKIGFVF